MLALSKSEARVGGVSLSEIDLPEPSPNEVRLKVAVAGICGTDVHVYNWLPWFTGRMKLPTVLGHELSGVIDTIGANVTGLHVGDRVSVESHIPCGHCYQCRTGIAHICANTRYPGIDINGGFAEYTVLPEKIIYPLPADLPLDIAAMFEPFGIGVHASLEGSGVAGQNVFIAGAGPIGLMNIAAARALGAHRVIASDISRARLDAAERMGADQVIDAGKEDPVAAVKNATGGVGADVVIEYSGVEASLHAAVECVAAGGEIRLVGVPEFAIGIDLNPWIMKGITVRGIHGRRLFSTWEHSVRLVTENKVDLKPLISHVFPLADAERSFEPILKGEAVKVLITPN